jgi:hypothetical protein
MHTNATSEPSGSPAPVLSPAPAHEADATHQPAARSALVRLLAAIRGDKYMVNAYPPAWRSAADAGVLSRSHDDHVSAAVQPVVVRDSGAVRGTTSAASRTKQR